ncbi:CHAT domain-containing protein [Streptomyces olivaceus]
MRLDELFPSAAAHLPSTEVSDSALAEPQGVVQVASLLQRRQRELLQSPFLMAEFSHALLTDIQALETGPAIAAPARPVLAMLVCWTPARQGFDHTQPLEMWRWLHSALGAPVSVEAGEATADIEPLVQALRDPVWAPTATGALLLLAPVLFYLNNNAHSADELAAALWPTVVDACRVRLATGDVHVVEAATQVVKYLVWKKHREEACALGHALERLLYADPQHPLAGGIAVLLAGESPAISHKDPMVIARWALATVPLNPFAALSLTTTLSVRMAAAERAAFFPTVLSQLRDVAALVSQETDPAQLSRDRGVLLSMQNPLVHTLLNEGPHENLRQWLSAWRGVPPEDARDDQCLLLANAGSRVWYRPGTAPDPDDDASLIRLTSAMNKALGRALVTRAMSDTALTTPATGRTSREHADALEAALRAHLDVADLAAFARKENAAAFVSMLPSLTPLQGLLARQGGPVLPISVSLRPPLADRSVRRVQMWCGDAPYAQAEAAVLQTVFTYAGIQCDVVGHDGVTRQRFLDAYSSDDYDVIWVAAHGHHPLLRPDDSAVVLTSTEQVFLQDLTAAPVPSTSRRRLLVLNTCDSAAANAQGPYDDFGLGRSIAGPGQAVIGHLWPVSGGAAVVFGALLAIELADGSTFADAFATALCALQENWSALAKRLGDRGIGAAIAEALQDFQTPCLLDWASPAFLE